MIITSALAVPYGYGSTCHDLLSFPGTPQSTFSFHSASSFKRQREIQAELAQKVNNLFQLRGLYRKQGTRDFVDQRIGIADRLLVLRDETRDPILRAELSRLYDDIRPLEERALKTSHAKKNRNTKRRILDLMKTIRGNLGEFVAALYTPDFVRRSIEFVDLVWMYTLDAKRGETKWERYTDLVGKESHFFGEVDFIFDYGHAWAEVKTSTHPISPKHGAFEKWLNQAERMSTIRRLMEDRRTIPKDLIKLHFFSANGVTTEAADQLREAGYDYVHLSGFLPTS